MKKISIMILMSVLALCAVTAQSDATAQTDTANQGTTEGEDAISGATTDEYGTEGEVAVTNAATDDNAKRVLYIYEEDNKSARPWRTLFSEELKAAGFEADQAAAAELGSINLADYDILVIHGMVIAFGSQSPVRDWLKTEPNLSGKPVSLFVTASRWRLEKVYKKMRELLEARKPVILDAVSSATKDLDDEGKRALVRERVQKLR